MIDWRSPPFSPIAGHYSRSKNHLPVNPFLNSRNPNSLRCVPFTAVTHPLSALNAPLVPTGQHTNDGGSARAGQTLGSACLGQDGQERLGGGRTVGV
jgi:hypothetical protein